MVVYAGQGDVRRSMELLWRTPGASAERAAPGPKPGLSVDVIVAEAIALADGEGMAALSMRAVGERLGRSAMALYTYVPSKRELVDLMHDAAHAELPRDYPAGDGWRAAVTAWAEDLWACYVRHPWVLQVSQARPVLGPHEYEVLETVLGLLSPAGLEAVTLRRIVSALFSFVRGAARIVAEARQATHVTGVSEDDWWYARSAALEEVAPDFADRFPKLTWLAGEGAFDLDTEGSYLEREGRESFEAGLAVLLDGVEAAARRAR